MENILEKLSKSKFRSSFKLKEKDICYIDKKGIDEIEDHANKFIKERLSNSVILNDGKQTPFKGHPVFIAQHATATCCRSCLKKWHGISKNKQLNEEEIKYIVKLIMFWIKENMKDNI